MRRSSIEQLGDAAVDHAPRFTFFPAGKLDGDGDCHVFIGEEAPRLFVAGHSPDLRCAVGRRLMKLDSEISTTGPMQAGFSRCRANELIRISIGFRDVVTTKVDTIRISCGV